MRIKALGSFHRSSKGLAILLGLVATGACIVAVVNRVTSLLLPTSFGALGCLVFVVGRRFLGGSGRSIAGRAARDRPHRRIFLLAALVFFALYSLSLVILRSATVGKPTGYFVTIAAAASLLAVQIGTGGERQRSMVLLELVAITGNLLLANQIAFPLGIGGADSQEHILMLIVPLLKTGHLAGAFSYVYFPGEHILVAGASLIADGDPVRMYYDLGALGMLFPVLIAYVAVRRFFGWRVGILSALLLSCASYFMFWAGYPVAQTFAIPLFAGASLELLYIQTSPRRSPRHIAVMVIFMIALVFTHAWTAVVLAITFVGMLLWRRIAAVGSRTSPGSRPQLASSLLLYSLVLLAQWMFYSFLLGNAVAMAQQYYHAIVSWDRLSPTRYDTLPLYLLFANTAADSLMILVAVVGGLLVFELERRDTEEALFGPTLTLLAVIGFGVASHVPYLFPQRMYVFLLLCGITPLAGYGLSRIASLPPDDRVPRPALKRVALASVLVGVIVLGSAASSIAGFETSPLYQGQPYVKLYDTAAERSGAVWICAHAESQSVDVSRGYSPYSVQYVVICIAQNGGDFGYLPVSGSGHIQLSSVRPRTLMLVSWSDVAYGFALGIASNQVYGDESVTRLAPSEYAKLLSTDRVYDNGWTEIYDFPPS